MNQTSPWSRAQHVIHVVRRIGAEIREFAIEDSFDIG